MTPSATLLQQQMDTQPMTMLDLPTLIHELKHDIATIILEMQAMFQQQATLRPTINHMSSSAT